MFRLWDTLFVLFCTIFVVRASEPDLKCLVCQRVIEEIDAEIQKIDPRKKINVGSFRIQPDGKQKEDLVSYARSTIHLMDLLENICENFKDYAEATYKSNGEKTVIRLVGSDGNMNPESGLVDFTPRGDLNSKLKFYCENIVEEYEDFITKLFNTEEQNIKKKLCIDESSICKSLTIKNREEL